MKFILNVIGGLGVGIGTLLFFMMAYAPCGAGVGKCGDDIALLIAIVFILAGAGSFYLSSKR